MKYWTAQEAAQATGGQAEGSWQAHGVVIDSRKVSEGALFVALKGERFDGHEFVREALSRGAAAAMVTQAPEGVPAERLLIVPDTLAALRALGAYARVRSTARILAVTGSVGKTGTKEMLRTALAASGKTYATQGNLNNHIGVPLSLANLPDDARFAVFELGMNHAGEIADLTAQVRPHVAIITTIEAVHLEFFPSVEAVADAKAEILQGMDADGVVLLNADNRYFERLRAAAVARGMRRVIAFGTGEGAESRLLDYQPAALGCEVTAQIRDIKLHYQIGALGKHWGVASLAVLAAAEAAGADLPKAASALAHFREPAGRGRLQLVSINGKDITLIDDSYNASPASMKAAMEKLSDIRRVAGEPRRRTVAVLGDMLELGVSSKELHLSLAPCLINNQIDLVFAAGGFMKHLYDTLPPAMRGDYAATAAELAPKVVRALEHRDIVLVKGSNGSRMSAVAAAIEAAQAEKEPA